MIRRVYSFATESGLTSVEHAQNDSGEWFVRVRKTRTRRGHILRSISPWVRYNVKAVPPINECNSELREVRLPGETDDS